MVTQRFKRRTASRQAVNRKAEGIEPRNRRGGKDDAVFRAEVNTGISANWQADTASPGSETMACLTSGYCGNPGGPEPLSSNREYAGQLKREEGKSGERESDSFVVPMKAGNAARGKEATHVSAE